MSIEKQVKAVILFRRGTAAEWNAKNPILRSGEPGIALDTGEFKIGDGVTSWNQLECKNEKYVIDKATHFEFPLIGKSDILYKASDECMLYQWSDKEMKYIPLKYNVFAEDITVDIICGGNASNVTTNS